MLNVPQVVRSILAQNKWTQVRLAEELGVSQPTIQRWLSHTQPDGPNRDKLLALYEEGQGFAPKRRDDEQRQSSGDVPNLTIHAGLGSGGLQHVEVDESGAVIDPNHTDGFWSFPDSVKTGLRHVRKTHALPVKGDSMEPTLPGGSFVFVDTTHIMPSPPDLYAVDYGDGLMIKRIELVPRSELVKVISDNERYASYEMQREELRVYGRVVASFQWRQ